MIEKVFEAMNLRRLDPSDYKAPFIADVAAAEKFKADQKAFTVLDAVKMLYASSNELCVKLGRRLQWNIVAASVDENGIVPHHAEENPRIAVDTGMSSNSRKRPMAGDARESKAAKVAVAATCTAATKAAVFDAKKSVACDKPKENSACEKRKPEATKDNAVTVVDLESSENEAEVSEADLETSNNDVEVSDRNQNVASNSSHAPERDGEMTDQMQNVESSSSHCLAEKVESSSSRNELQSYYEARYDFASASLAVLKSEPDLAAVAVKKQKTNPHQAWFAHQVEPVKFFLASQFLYVFYDATLEVYKPLLGSDPKKRLKKQELMNYKGFSKNGKTIRVVELMEHFGRGKYPNDGGVAQKMNWLPQSVVNQVARSLTRELFLNVKALSCWSRKYEVRCLMHYLHEYSEMNGSEATCRLCQRIETDIASIVSSQYHITLMLPRSAEENVRHYP